MCGLFETLNRYSARHYNHRCRVASPRKQLFFEIDPAPFSTQYDTLNSSTTCNLVTLFSEISPTIKNSLWLQINKKLRLTFKIIICSRFVIQTFGDFIRTHEVWHFISLPTSDTYSTSIKFQLFFVYWNEMLQKNNVFIMSMMFWWTSGASHATRALFLY